MDRFRIVVMAKEPQVGRVKTRLCPPLTPDQACCLYDAFLFDTLDRLGELGVPVCVYGTSTDGDARPLAEGRLGEICRATGAELHSQVQGHLGARMQAAFGEQLRLSARVVVVGADSPDLPVGRIGEAVGALQDAEICLGPAGDGGYYLIAARMVPTALLGADIPWGTGGVLEATRRCCENAGLVHVELARWDDVDKPDDLRRLVERLDANRAESLVRTRSVLAGLDWAR